MLTLARQFLSKPKVLLVGVGMVGVFGGASSVMGLQYLMSSKAQKAAAVKREKENQAQANVKKEKADRREWNQNFNAIQQARKHGPFAVPDKKKKKKPKPANWGKPKTDSPPKEDALAKEEEVEEEVSAVGLVETTERAVMVEQEVPVVVVEEEVSAVGLVETTERAVMVEQEVPVVVVEEEVSAVGLVATTERVVMVEEEVPVVVVEEVSAVATTKEV